MNVLFQYSNSVFKYWAKIAPSWIQMFKFFLKIALLWNYPSLVVLGEYFID